MRWYSMTKKERYVRRRNALRARGLEWRRWFAWYPTRPSGSDGEPRSELVWLERYFYRSKNGDNRAPWIRITAAEWFKLSATGVMQERAYQAADQR